MTFEGQVMGVIGHPRDEILIFSTSLGIVVHFLLLMLSLHYVTSEDKKFWTHASLIFSVIYAVFVTANYVVQLATVLPMKLANNADSIRILEPPPFIVLGFRCHRVYLHGTCHPVCDSGDRQIGF